MAQHGNERQESFGGLLRRYRLAAGLTQEALAERAGLSVRGLSDLERDLKHAPRLDTLRLLGEALQLSAAERSTLQAATAASRDWAAAGGASAPTAPVPALSGVLPTGTLTFLFTDIESSSALWEQQPDAMRAALARHDALIDETLAHYGGRQVKERGEGDSIFAVFTSPSAALAAGCALQQALLAEPWPTQTPVRVRMALHTGEAEQRASSYYGVTVNRTARLRGLGHGGQILLSAATVGLVRDALPTGASLCSLGWHRLQGLAEPEEVCQLCHPDLPGEFPPLRSPQAPRHNLPRALTGLIGREWEQGEVLAMLAHERLVTLVGTGGVGKTRLALEVAAELVDQYTDGVWLVELAPLADPALVVGAVAQVLGLREEPKCPILATLTGHLSRRRLLLVVDNCEHLVAACAALIGPLLRAAPDLRVLATSREGLGVTGEQQYRVPSLSVPDPRHLPPVELVSSYAAVRLFVARAQERRWDFVLDERNAHVVAALCARLDGIPLALVLAAARVGSLPVEAIAERLDQRFRLLTSGSRDAPSRQQTLRAALDWSWDLLTAPERALLRRLSVFASGWALTTAETVCAGHGMEGWEILDLLDALVNKSLVGLQEGEDGTRYRLLETVREYARERLAVAGETAQVGDQHLAWCLALAERAELALVGPQQDVWLARLEQEHDNLRAALQWSLENQEVELGLRLAGAIWRFWYTHGHLSEGRWHLERLLASPGSTAPEALSARAKALYGASVLANEQADYPRVAMLAEEALGLYSGLDDLKGVASSLNVLALVARLTGDLARATALHAESLALARELGDGSGIGRVLSNLGVLARDQGNYAEAATLYEESLKVYRPLGDEQGIAIALTNLAEALRYQEDYARAKPLYRESLVIHAKAGNRLGIVECLEGLAAIAHGEHLLERAARLWGAAAALRRLVGAAQQPADRADYERHVAALRSDLAEAVLVTAWAEGGSLTLEAAIALAREDGLGDVPGSDATGTR